MFSVGYNIPGCLLINNPEECETIEDAWAILKQTIDHHKECMEEYNEPLSDHDWMVIGALINSTPRVINIKFGDLIFFIQEI